MFRKLFPFAAALTVIFSIQCFAADLTPGMIAYDEETACLDSADIPDVFWDNGADFEVRKDNTVSSITVTGEGIQTFRNIHVGDSVNKVRSKFDLEYEQNGHIGALFSGEEELDMEEVAGMEESTYTPEILDAVMLQYECTDGKVSSILIETIASKLGITPISPDDYPEADIELTKNQVYVDGVVLTYNEPVPEELSQYTYTKVFEMDVPDDAPVSIFVNKDGIARAINILSPSVQTFDSIRVGDKMDTVQETYEKIVSAPSALYAYWQGDKMLTQEDMPVDDYLVYTYSKIHYHDSQIGRITICDMEYAKAAR